MPRMAPGPPGNGYWGHLERFRCDALGLLDEASSRFENVVRFRLGTRVIHLVNHPKGVEQVLIKQVHNYDKLTRSARIISEICGPSLLTTDGEFWRRQRRLAQPAFQPARVATFDSIVADAAAALQERWKEPAASGATIDVASEMGRLTFDVVGRALFGAELAQDADTVQQALAIVLEQTYHRLRAVINVPRWVPSRANREFARALRSIDQVVYRILQERRREKFARDDLLGRLMTAGAEGGGGMNDQQLRNEILTLLMAGLETTANALTWTFYLLAQSPEADARLHKEVQSSSPRERSEPLPFTMAVVQESLRLYPPIWIIERRVVADDEIDGYHIPAGSTVVVSPYALHRRGCFWPDPVSFNPDRFMADDSQRPAHSYLPFGLGPHHCIGNHFALMEARIVLAAVIARYRLIPVPGLSIEPRPGITLRPRHGLKMRLAVRS